jgi:hypothetical protein
MVRYAVVSKFSVGNAFNEEENYVADERKHVELKGGMKKLFIVQFHCKQ